MSTLPTEVHQSVPVDLSLTVPLEGGGTLEVKVPLTINLTLSVSVQASGAVSALAEVEGVAGEQTPGLEPDDGRLRDANGISYTLEEPAEMEILQASTATDPLGQLIVIGQVKNVSKLVIEYPQVVVNLYDVKGRMLAMDQTYLAAEKLRPGRTSSFQASFGSKKYPSMASFSVGIVS